MSTRSLTESGMPTRVGLDPHPKAFSLGFFKEAFLGVFTLGIYWGYKRMKRSREFNEEQELKRVEILRKMKEDYARIR